jgi:hypothetical protein
VLGVGRFRNQELEKRLQLLSALEGHSTNTLLDDPLLWCKELVRDMKGIGPFGAMVVARVLLYKQSRGVVKDEAVCIDHGAKKFLVYYRVALKDMEAVTRQLQGAIAAAVAKELKAPKYSVAQQRRLRKKNTPQEEVTVSKYTVVEQTVLTKLLCRWMSFLEMEQMYCEALRRMKKGNKLTTEARTAALDGETVVDWSEEGELEVGGAMRFPDLTSEPGYYKLVGYDELTIAPKVAETVEVEMAEAEPMEVEPETMEVEVVEVETAAGSGAGAGSGGGSSDFSKLDLTQDVPADCDAYTITFGDRAENSIGMPMEGTAAAVGLTPAELKDICTLAQKDGYTCELTNLNSYLPDGVAATDAAVLVIRNGVQWIGGCTADSLFREVLTHRCTKWWFHSMNQGTQPGKRFMDPYGYDGLTNRQGHFNNCYGEERKDPNPATKQGTVMAFDETVLVKQLRERLPMATQNPKLEGLAAEGNFYFDIKNCGIGAHGDAERKITIGMRAGEPFPLAFCWFKKGKTISQRIDVNLAAGDVYFMSDKATGHDWQEGEKKGNSVGPYLKHAAGRHSKHYTAMRSEEEKAVAKTAAKSKKQGRTGGSSAAAATQAMPPPAPQSPAPAPAPAAAQSPVEQQLAQVMAMMQTMNQRLASAEDRAKAAEAERDQAKEDLKASHERTEKLSGREGQKKKQSRSS